MLMRYRMLVGKYIPVQYGIVSGGEHMSDVKKFRTAYLIGALIVWVGIILGTAVMLSGTEYLIQILIILGGGAFWFVVIVPGAFFRKSRELGPRSTPE
jgi:hypothetical protein